MPEGKSNKKPRKQITEAQKAARLENLRKGREQLKLNRAQKPEDDVSDDSSGSDSEGIEYVISKPNKAPRAKKEPELQYNLIQDVKQLKEVTAQLVKLQKKQIRQSKVPQPTPVESKVVYVQQPTQMPPPQQKQDHSMDALRHVLFGTK